VGVLLIAYGLLNPRTAAQGWDATYARPVLAGDRVVLRDDVYAIRNGYDSGLVRVVDPGASEVRYVQSSSPAVPVRTVNVTPAPASRPVTRYVERPSARNERRNWTKTMAVIGGSSAAGAGIGAIFGGKKGALIGAAVGGGASTIYEATK
jgi:hypothetical protein